MNKGVLSFSLMGLWFVILIAITSCTKVVDIDLPSHEPKIAVNSLFTDGRSIRVHLARTTSILDDSDPLITNATIELRQDDVPTDTFYFSSGYYYSHIIAEREKKYSLVIKVPDLSDVTCEDIIPERTLIESHSHTDSIMMDSNKFPVMQLGLTFTDEPGVNYYELSIIADYISDGYQRKGPVWFAATTDPVLNATGLLDYQPQSIVFSDDLFDGNQISLKVNYSIQTGEIPLIGSGPAYGYKLFVSLRSISHPYYQYRRKQIIYSFLQETDIFTGMHDPVTLYTNINGGYGIFAGYSSDNKTINIIID
jgi:hypothetical protein